MEQRAESIPTSRSAGADYYEGKSALARPRSTGRAFQKEMNVRHKLTKARMQMVFVMVGLPARGKSFISRRLESFLSWKGHTTKVFNVGKYRREAVVATESGKSDFFDPHNSTAKAQREAVALLALEDMLDWLSKEGEIGIFDATNSTEERRQLIIRVCRESGRELGIVFIETLCTNRDVLEENMRCKVAGSPDFATMNEEEALADLRARIAKYEAVYETIREEADYSYIKLFNMSSRVLVSGVYGQVAQSVLPYLMAIHIGPRPVWLVRAGEGVGLRTSKTFSSIGSPLAQLTESGKEFAEVLSDYVRDQIRAFRELDEDASAVSRRYSRHLSDHAAMAFRDVVVAAQKAHASGGCASRDVSRSRQASAEIEAGAHAGAGAGAGGSVPEPASGVGSGGGSCGSLGTGHHRNSSPDMRPGSSNSAHRGSSACDATSPRIDGCERDGGSHADGFSIGGVGHSPAVDRADDTKLRRTRRVTKKWQESVVRAANGVVDSRAQLKVLTSTLPRAIATVEKLRTPCSKEEYFMLTPLDKGSHMGLSLDEIASSDPKWMERFQKDYLNVRFPGGECYHDLMNRLEQVLIEIEQQTMPVLIVSHVSVLQVLLCYFRNVPVREAPHIEVPLHTVIELQPTIGGPWVETRTELVPPDSSSDNPLGLRAESTGELYQPCMLESSSSQDVPEVTLPEPGPLLGGLRKTCLVSSTELNELTARLEMSEGAADGPSGADTARGPSPPPTDNEGWNHAGGRDSSPHRIRHAGLG